MTTRLNPYINFVDNAREAMEFYHGILGGELTISTFGDMGATDNPDGVMHAMITTDSGLALMASDTPDGMNRTPGDNVQISLSGDDAETLRGFWEGLSDGANVEVPMEKQMWGDEFGMLVDKFDIRWLVNIAGSAPGGAADETDGEAPAEVAGE